MVFIDIHTHSSSSNSDTIAIRSFRFGVEQINYHLKHISAAIHPWDAESANDQLDDFEKNINKFALVSEIGLDSLHDNFEKQIELFNSQMIIASKHNKAVVIHTVRAHNETLKILAQYKDVTKIIHSFIGSKQQADDYLRIGCYLSFSSRSFKSPKTSLALRSVPLDKIFLETDEEQFTIEKLYNRAAEILEIDIEELKEEIYKNYNRVCLNHAQSY